MIIFLCLDFAIGWLVLNWSVPIPIKSGPARRPEYTHELGSLKGRSRRICRSFGWSKMYLKEGMTYVNVLRCLNSSMTHIEKAVLELVLWQCLCIMS